jgi:hypothetical protein
MLDFLMGLSFTGFIDWMMNQVFRRIAAWRDKMDTQR